jgi:hypothetical protein
VNRHVSESATVSLIKRIEKKRKDILDQMPFTFDPGLFPIGLVDAN